MKIVSVVGTRPQLIKAAVLEPVLRARHEAALVDTGQHYDEALAGAFFGELGLARPEHSLGIAGGTHAQQTAVMLAALEPVVAGEHPDAVLVYGDTNSTLAGALVAAKLTLPLAHVEAGLRSFDRRMPEEVNRVVADHLARWLLAPTETAVANLAAEGIREGVHLVGDLMQDLAARVAPMVRDPAVLGEIERRLAADAPGLTLRPGDYLFATIHRQENREAGAMRAWSVLLGAVARPDRPVVLALHPGTRAAMVRERIDAPQNVAIVGPQSYRTSLALQLHAAAVITDSGGVQREAGWLGTPCLVLRETTEWIEAMRASEGKMVVVGLDADRASAEIERLAPRKRVGEMARVRAGSLTLGRAGAAEAIVQALGDHGVTLGPA